MTRARAIIWLVCAILAGSSLPLCAQGPAQAQTPPAAAPAAPASTIRVGSRVGETPTQYDDGGRRDPFVSLIVPKAAPSSAGGAVSRPPFVAGLAGISVSDVTVKGTVRSGTTLIALLQGPDGKTYMAKRLDRLQDGVVTRIDSDGVVFTERTADAAGMVRARDVRKPLRQAVSGSGGQS